VFAVRKFSISPLTYLRKISLRTTANVDETENQRVSVERLQRYVDLTIFKMATIRHLGFLKLKFLMVRTVTRPIFALPYKFPEDPPNRCGDIVIFVISRLRPPPTWI